MAFACYSKGRKVGKKTERNERTKKDRSTKGSLENRKENLEKMVVKKGEKKERKYGRKKEKKGKREEMVTEKRRVF